MKFCIVGTGRCGTRLLREMLDRHPDVFVFNETHWIPELYNRYGMSATAPEEMLKLISRTFHVRGDLITEFDHQEFLRHSGCPQLMTVADFCNALGLYYARRYGKSLWADKTPDYGNFASVLQLYWPDCKIIHMIRDGASVVRSMSDHTGYRALALKKQHYWSSIALDFAGTTETIEKRPIAEFVDLWFDRLLRTRDEAKRLKPGTYMEIRHEDVLADPARELGRVAQFTRLAPDAGWLGDLKSSLDPVKLNKPKPKGILAHFSDRHKKLLEELGYETEES